MTGRLLQHYEPHRAAVNSLAFHPSGDYLASSGDDATVCLMDLKEGTSFSCCLACLKACSPDFQRHEPLLLTKIVFEFTIVQVASAPS